MAPPRLAQGDGLFCGHRPLFTFAVVALLALLALLGPRAFAATRPSFVVMMTDDQRWDALGAAGNMILPTPNLDRLASEGMRFRQMFVTNALCAPSRATLLTGLYSHAHGVIDNNRRRLAADRPLLSDLLRGAGYKVGFCGKSHVEGALRDREWDYYFGFQGQGDYHNPKVAEGTAGPDRAYPGAYVDDLVTDKALAWIERLPTDQPFCLFLWFKAPHRSWQRARRHHDLFRDVVIPKPPTYDDDLRGYPGKPRAFAEADNKIGDFIDVRTLEGFVKDYYATIVAVDENVGRVLDTLDQRGRAEDTMVLFTSDNGFFHGEWRAFDKRFMHEPSIRVPLLVRYPRLVRPGSVDDHQAINVDLAPTLLDLAGVTDVPPMHGRSLLPLLRGESPEWREDWLYEYYEFPGAHSVRKHRGVRSTRYKYIHYYESPEEFELYDLQADPGERENLANSSEHTAIRAQLAERLTALRKETGDPGP